jgi:imidazolonepropionase-like amidohydrolase
MKSPIALLSAAAMPLLLAGALFAAPAGAQSFTIVGACVFDGERVLPPGTEVRVENGLILAVGPRVGLARGASIIDARGKTLVPGVLGSPHGQPASQARRLAAAGAPPAQALRAIADAAATTQNTPGPVAIVTGARANFSLLQGDAAEDLRTLSDIVAVWKNGLRVRGIGRSGPAM